MTANRQPPRPGVTFVDAYPHLYAGAQRTLRLLAGALHQRGWAVDAVLPGDGRLADELRAVGIPVTVVKVPPALRRYGASLARPSAVATLPEPWARLAWVLGRRPGLVHVNDHRGMLLAGPAARLARRPVVWHIHAVVRAAMVEQFGRRLAKAVIVPSAATVAALGPAGMGAVVVGGALDPAQIVPAGPAAEPPVVATLARLDPVKGVDVLVEAMARARREVPGLRALVLGDHQAGQEAYAASVRDRLAALDLSGVVEIRAGVRRPAEEWKTAAVYVQPSRSETLGLATIEAMACGLPVVATAVGGLAEVVDDGRTGLLVPPDDPERLAEAIVTLVRDRVRAAALARAARVEVGSRYSVDAFVDRVLAVYRKVRR